MIISLAAQLLYFRTHVIFLHTNANSRVFQPSKRYQSPYPLIAPGSYFSAHANASGALNLGKLLGDLQKAAHVLAVLPRLAAESPASVAHSGYVVGS